jgi:uncharacterized protein YfkK (UPF0435 family)
MEAHAFAAVRARAEKNAAERDVALDALADVVRIVDRKAYLSPAHQAAIARADAVLAEAGRRIR